MDFVCNFFLIDIWHTRIKHVLCDHLSFKRTHMCVTMKPVWFLWQLNLMIHTYHHMTLKPWIPHEETTGSLFCTISTILDWVAFFVLSILTAHWDRAILFASVPNKDIYSIWHLTVLVNSNNTSLLFKGLFLDKQMIKLSACLTHVCRVTVF